MVVFSGEFAASAILGCVGFFMTKLTIRSIKTYVKMKIFEMPIVTREIAIKYLIDHNVVAIPTETVYGLAADATSDEADAKI